ncbi:Leucine carboxyl methyltransferase [Kalmanozyma brasiliensis GHG001]|uniref:Leucine carboxyl methyltransferase n=1 Tax=Kalmanozyma brasiliensis (strain GHG001) TaxID=1365824 RepID=UPI0028682054|nr:Leucine carboxyl methyltransferase [Kalmanozyma brasiliensis GHG001]EST09112.2 Leucine carboxyl methyltransferase [Kalmanozyma brasiliensis GHG001]
MQRSNPLRDPFANEDDLTGPSARPTRLPGSNEVAGASAGSAVAPRSLGLSLGLPRSRMGARRCQSDDPASSAGDSRRADEAVRNTDSDALLSRLSALKLGYLPAEPFTQEFATSSASNGGEAAGQHGCPRSHQPEAPARRSPLINIGTYLRCTAIDAEVESFLTQGEGQKQIISIGAGSDSRYWRIMSNPDLSKHLHHYAEIDFAENTNHKLTRISKSSILRSSLDPDSSVHGGSLTNLSEQGQQREPHQGSKRFDVLRSSKYSLLAADLRSLHPDTVAADRIDVEHLLGPDSTGLQSELPTLILFECVLAYIAPEEADLLIQLLGQRYADISAVSYDIALAGDDNTRAAPSAVSPSIPPSRFGRVMLQNLEMRKLSLPGAKAYPTINAQSQRFAQAWSSASSGQAAPVETSGRSLFSIWSSLDAGQKSRLSRLEGLDEVEEIDMLLKHYCIVRARRMPR